jgi:heme a synthase
VVDPAPSAASRGSVSLFDPWRHRFALLTAVSTLLLIFVGGLVTSTESGLSVPDWPLSYGMVMPPMVGGVFYEHGHRMAASFVGFLTLVLAVWTWRREARAGVRRLGWLALLAVIVQGLLGGLTVIYLLPTAISVTHACLAQTFFLLTIAMAYGTSREWLTAAPLAEDRAGMRSATFFATGVVYVQLLLGALMRHLDAGLAIPDFPLAFGRLVPPLGDPHVAVHFAHRVGAVFVLVAVVRLYLAARRNGDVLYGRPARILLVLITAQIALGASVIWTGRAVYWTTAHVATGAAVLGTCFFVALRAHRHLRAADAEVGVPTARALHS